MLKDLARWVRRSTKERANGKQSSPRREDYSPGRRKGLHWLAQIRTFAISQREEFSLCTSKFESDMPSHGVGLYGGIFQRGYCCTQGQGSGLVTRRRTGLEWCPCCGGTLHKIGINGVTRGDAPDPPLPLCEFRAEPSAADRQTAGLSGTRSPSDFSECSVSPSFLRTTPARKPRTERACRPVASLMAVTVAPSGRLNSASTAACFELLRVL